MNDKSNLINKKKYGQFYTTNYKYILNNLIIPLNINHIIEPFCGNGDLLDFINHFNKINNTVIKNKIQIDCYDIEPKKEFIIKKDTIQEPPNYNNTFIITNPPYLARNKSKNKELFDKYDVNDLYKCFIKEIMNNVCLGGILIIPLNFWSSIRQSDIELRKTFLEKYKIILLNIFEEQVFNDTTYTICSFQFELKSKHEISKNLLNIDIYPSNKNIKIELNELNNYLIGGNIYKLKLNNEYKITRLTKKNKNKKSTNILVKCIDNNENNKIGFKYVEDKDKFIDNTANLSARTFATLIIEPEIELDKQKILIEKFNRFLNENREKYHSLFLTNYRESKDIARKRISFDLIYNITCYILENFDTI
jgi:hypothetical protein